MQLLNDLFDIIDKEETDGGLTYRVSFNPAHLIYKVHFPGNPITPGVCLIQMTEELLSHHLNRPLYLSCLSNVKFLSTLTPVADAVVSFSFGKLSVTEQECRAQLTIGDAGQTYAKLSMQYSYDTL
ncbi:MAG: 3-hydroxyacyl-ACP dehydratase [Prevotellaceae bacterium]|jgi:3-hydroxyacyl-[acyl-carrier-protein] dehydratase|nr:3-hydroxyacyl-ACP dehydratase [Prevotellaceae bacterium]